MPFVNGSSLLKLKDGSTYCTGNLTDVDSMSVSCTDSADGCTWGSVVSVFAQGTPQTYLNVGNHFFSINFMLRSVNATADFPHKSRVVFTPSVPHLFGFGGWDSIESTEYTSNYCNSVLHAPAGADAGYTCPDAGLYNFRVTFPLFGESLAWYSDLYGFNIALNMKISNAETGDDYAYCYAEVNVKKGPYRHTSHGASTTWGAVLGGAGMAGLAAALGYAYRKRRVTTADNTPDEMVTNFELVNDQIMQV